MNEEKKAELKTDLTDLRHAALDLAHEAIAERSAEFDARLQAAREQAALDEMERRTKPPRVVAEDGTSRSVFDLQPGTAPKVTPADIEAEIASEHYFTAMNGVSGANEAKAIDGQIDFDTKAPAALDLLTFCVLVLRNGFTVTGESACASPENFDAEVGRKVARAAAVAQMWKLLGFRLRDRLASAHPVLDMAKLAKLDPPSWQTSPAPVPVVAVDPVDIEFNVIFGNHDFSYLVVAKGCRGDLVRIEREQVKQAHTEDEHRRFVTEAKQLAAARVQKWFDKFDAGNALQDGDE